MQNKHSIGSIPIFLIFSHLYPVLEYNFFKQNYCAISQIPFIFLFLSLFPNLPLFPSAIILSFLPVCLKFQLRSWFFFNSSPLVASLYALSNLLLN